MSDEGRHYVRKFSPLDGSDFIVHYFMGDLVNRDNNYEIWAGDEWFAKECRVSVKTLQRVRNRMIEDGLLEVVDSITAPKRNARYRMLSPLPNGGQFFENGGQSDHRTVDISESSPITNEIQTKEPKFLEDFEEAWKVYPRKVSKKAALRAYTAQRRKGVSHETLLLSASSYLTHTRAEKLEERYMKHGATFFGPDDHWADFVDDSTAILAPAQEPEATIIDPEEVIEAFRCANAGKPWIDPATKVRHSAAEHPRYFGLVDPSNLPSEGPIRRPGAAESFFDTPIAKNLLSEPGAS